MGLVSFESQEPLACHSDMDPLGLTRKKKLERWSEPLGRDWYPAEKVVGGWGEWQCQPPGLEGGITILAGRLLWARERGAIFGLMPLGSLAKTQQLD